MEEPEDLKRSLSEAERKRARARWTQISTVTKATSHFKNSLNTRRRNLVAHLGVDEEVCKKEVQEINLLALPVPSILKPPEEPLSKCCRYVLPFYHNTFSTLIRI